MQLRLLGTLLAGLRIAVLICAALSVQAAPYAAMVIDARTGEVLHSRNADTRLHPASLTKMMTLYVAFEAIRNGEISLDTRVKISRKAAAEEPSRLGLKAGQRIALRYLIRAAAIKSANDAATAIGEAIEGSEAAFARRMNRTAKALGMNSTTFKNAHGLTERGHMSTARDMTKLGRHLLYGFPQYYNLFSRNGVSAGTAKVYNTNRRFLGSYRGADGIKTGYTRAAGFNLVASAERGDKRIIATMFGGTSSAQRNARVADLLDMGFSRAPRYAKLRRPAMPRYAAKSGQATLVARSPRPVMRLRPRGTPVSDDMLMALVEEIEENTARLSDPETPAGDASSHRPAQRPAGQKPVAEDTQVASSETEGRQQVITRGTTSGGRHWAISLGAHRSRHSAERFLLKTALQEIETLDEALRKVVDRPQGWEANFVGLSQDRAVLACQRLSARGVGCEVRGPGA